MNNIKKIIETLRTNEDIAQSFFEIETSILSVLNFKDLFEKLLTEIKEKFEIPYVWISIIDNSEVYKLTEALSSSEILKERLNFIDRMTFTNLTGNKTKPVLINNNLKAFYKLMPQKHKYFIGSIAVAPLTVDGQIIGSLNQADHSEEHFKPNMDTGLLEQLAVKISICLSNVIAHEKLKSLAFRDPLTGLLNRRVMDDTLKKEFKRAKRYINPLSVIYLDIDDLKIANDRYGHDVGDDLLKYAATHLEDISRESDIVARVGGDEFIIILPNTTTEETYDFVNRVQDFFQKNPLETRGISTPVSISFGIASTEDRSIGEAESLLKKADIMLYHAKKLKSERYSTNYAIE
jgi:diguanylate cyclase (GGDEF)-like protein